MGRIQRRETGCRRKQKLRHARPWVQQRVLVGFDAGLMGAGGG